MTPSEVRLTFSKDVILRGLTSVCLSQIWIRQAAPNSKQRFAVSYFSSGKCTLRSAPPRDLTHA
eukprot:m.353090 g.353090  ORF g.353090 m.353090 type:complete len:64 (+) comp55919_c0_seq12:1324-1515(+)